MTDLKSLSDGQIGPDFALQTAACKQQRCLSSAYALHHSIISSRPPLRTSRSYTNQACHEQPSLLSSHPSHHRIEDSKHHVSL